MFVAHHPLLVLRQRLDAQRVQIERICRTDKLYDYQLAYFLLEGHILEDQVDVLLRGEFPARRCSWRSRTVRVKLIIGRL